MKEPSLELMTNHERKAECVQKHQRLLWTCLPLASARIGLLA